MLLMTGTESETRSKSRKATKISSGVKAANMAGLLKELQVMVGETRRYIAV